MESPESEYKGGARGVNSSGTRVGQVSKSDKSVWPGESTGAFGFASGKIIFAEEKETAVR
jgi:hypothetical protein